MSWLKRLSQVYQDYLYPDRSVALPESRNCEVNLRSLDADAVVLNFEKMVDDRTRTSGNLLPKKCDIVAVHGSDVLCRILLIEVKAGVTRPLKTAAEAAVQLKNSKRIIEESVPECDVRVPNDLVWDAVIVSGSIDQQLMTRSEMPKIVAGFYTQTGILLRLVRCGDDILAGRNGG